MAAFVLVYLEVADYDASKQMFDTDPAGRNGPPRGM
jgi:hypothetical protein